ncbi:Lrp/AsnC family transcriptional regulator [Nocardia sp. NPDC088792]|uniref:Lrp/AsnC family transcriptional regulator n=1 Tax=Nocardia sp. NPDC088792 TaxID=3364332 RepID=UPI00381B8C72
MITAIILISTDPDLVIEAAQQVADIEGVSELYSCGGEVDLIAIVRVPRMEQVRQLVVERIAEVRGISRTSTHIAFRSYSTEFASGAFSIGFAQQPMEAVTG